MPALGGATTHDATGRSAVLNPTYRMNELIAPAVAAQPQAIALTSAGLSITYDELDRLAGRVAAAALHAGVGAQDRLAFIGKNSVEQIEVILGCARLDAVVVSVNWRLPSADLAYIVDDMEAEVVFVDALLLDAVLPMLLTLTRVTTVVAIGADAPIGGSIPFSAWIAGHEPIGSVEVAPGDAALQIYTSGTTGRPKGVTLSHAAVTATMPAMSRQWRTDHTSVMLTVLPWFHIAGLGAVIGALGAGGTVVISNDTDADRLLDSVEAHGVTNLVLASIILQWIVNSPKAATTDLSSLRVISYGASPITQETLRAAIALFGCDLVQIYGLTETMGTVTVLDAGDHLIGDGPDRLLSCGRAADGVEVRLVDPDELTDVATGEVGEIWARSPRNMTGYWHSPEETAAALTEDGWLRTGDLARLDAEGYVFLCDRLKDMIVTGGENVYPTEVENVLQWHPAIAEVTVIGVPDDRWGETPKALVVLQPGATPTAGELIAYSRERLAHFKCPTSVEFVESLPKTPSGKVLKRSLRAAYWDGMQRRNPASGA